jgi:hypothetical protein
MAWILFRAICLLFLDKPLLNHFEGIFFWDMTRCCRVEVTNIWSWAPDGARHQGRQTDWPTVAIWLWLWSAASLVRARVQFAPAHDKESRVQNREMEDRVSSLYVMNCKVNNCSSAKERSNKPSVKNKHSTSYCHITRGTSDNSNTEEFKNFQPTFWRSDKSYPTLLLSTEAPCLNFA